MELDENMDLLLLFAFQFLLTLCKVIYYEMSTTTAKKKSEECNLKKKYKRYGSLVHIIKY